MNDVSVQRNLIQVEAHLEHRRVYKSFCVFVNKLLIIEKEVFYLPLS